MNLTAIKEACQDILVEILEERCSPYTEELQTFIMHEATLEQLLNLCLVENSTQEMVDKEIILSEIFAVRPPMSEEEREAKAADKRLRRGAKWGARAGALAGLGVARHQIAKAKANRIMSGEKLGLRKGMQMAGANWKKTL